MNTHAAQPQRTGAIGGLTAAETISLFQKAAPVDVRAIAKALDIEVVEDDALPQSVSGKIEVVGFLTNRYRITVNSHHAPTRRRFTIAHELAHFVLHRSMIGDGIVDDAMYRSDRGDWVERQANSYAATILMPAPLVREKFRAGTRDYASMANTFDVSPEVARIRMKELRLG